MKRNMDLIRSALLKLEPDIGLHPKTYEFQYDNGKLCIDGHSDEDV